MKARHRFSVGYWVGALLGVLATYLVCGCSSPGAGYQVGRNVQVFDARTKLVLPLSGCKVNADGATDDGGLQVECFVDSPSGLIQGEGSR